MAPRPPVAEALVPRHAATLWELLTCAHYAWRLRSFFAPPVPLWRGRSPMSEKWRRLRSTTVPPGWLPTNGALLPIASYTVLYDLLGTTYGGDGVTNFGLPNTKVAGTKTKANLHQCIAYLGVYPSQN